MPQPQKAVSHNAATLRPTTEADLPAISELTEAVFGRRRSPEVLRWLLLSAQPGLDLQSEVAINDDDGRIVGHVGSLKCLYQWGQHIAVGAHPMLWMLHPDARGRIGIQLGHTGTRVGDFSLVVGGTPNSKPIMERRRFVRTATTTELRLPTDAAGAAVAGDLELQPFEPAPTRLLPATGPVVSLPTPARLNWLAACPTLETRLFSVYRDGENLGPMLLYVNRRGDEPSGRIVHLPRADDDWGAFVRLALAELASAGCKSASILATCDNQLETVTALGGEPFYERVIYFRNQSGLPEASSWHLSYLEGDLAYRRV